MAQIKTKGIADDAVGLAQMAVGTDGNIISYDASTNPVAIATGSDGQVLTSTGAGSPPAFEAVSAGTALTGSTNNTIPTVTGANAISGEANLTYNGTFLGVGSGADLGTGVHTKNGDSGASIVAEFDDLILENSADTGINILSGTGNEGGIIWSDSGATKRGYIIFSHPIDNMRFGIANAEKMRLNSVGAGFGAIPTPDLGVGVHIKTADSGSDVNSTYDELVIEGSAHAGMTILTGTSHVGGIMFGDSGDNDAGFIKYDNSGNKFEIGTAGAERLRIDSSGNLLVGTTSTTINASNFGLKIASSGIISSSANVSGGSTAAEHFGNAGQCRIMGDGDAENTNNSYGALSDERLKENITDANSQWNDIKELQIKNYNLIAYPDRTHIGVIAQDLETAEMNGLVQETKPEVEHIEIDSNFGTIEDDTDHPILDDEGNETGTYQQKVKTVNSKVKSVKYSILYMKAIKALQEAQTRIETLETKVTALENA